MSDLVERARAWVVAVHPHPYHLERTLAWLLELDPDAGDALQIAAVTHDIERAFPAAEDPFADNRDPTAGEYNDWHQRRCAQIVGEWLREQDAPEPLIAEVSKLVGVHELGGWPDADLLQAADSLSFLEVQTDHFAGLVRSGRLTLDAAQRKLRYMAERIRWEPAREIAEPMLETALARLAAQATVQIN